MKSLRLWFLVLLAFAIPIAFAQAKVVVKPNDTVNVVCEEEPSLSKDYVITRDGFIVMQFIGAVSIAGLDEKAAAAKLSATFIEQRILARATIRLKIMGSSSGGLISYFGAVAKAGDLFPREGLRLSDVVREAQPTAAADMMRVRIVTADGKTVMVDFAAFDGTKMENNPLVRAGDRIYFDLVARTPDITVTGMVAKPGIVPFTRGLTVRGAIRAVGGIGPGADETLVRVEREGQTLPTLNVRETDRELQAGDRVFVPGGAPIRFITVTGMVKTPQRLPMRDNMTLNDAIQAAGGALPGADLSKVKILRKIDGKEKTYFHDVSSAQSGMSGPFEIMANDIVAVNSPPKKSFSNRNGTMLKIAGIAILAFLLGFGF